MGSDIVFVIATDHLLVVKYVQLSTNLIFKGNLGKSW